MKTATKRPQRSAGKAPQILPSHSKKKIPRTQKGTVPVRRVKDAARVKKPWQLSYIESGRRHRVYFASEKEALEEWIRIHRVQESAGKGAVRFNKDAYYEWNEAKRITGPDVSLIDIAREWARNQQDHPSNVTCAQACERFLQSKKELGRSGPHLNSLLVHLSVLSGMYADMPVSRISRDHIMHALNSLHLAPRSVWNHRTSFSNFFQYAIRNQWCGRNPVANILREDLPRIVPKPKRVLTIKTSLAILRAAEAIAPEVIPGFCIRLFAGIRETEASKFRSEWLDLKQQRITIPAKICKTADDWVIQNLEPVIWEWLQAYPVTGDFPSPSDYIWERIKQKAGFTSRFGPGRYGIWPRNGFRRSFCTYHISLHESASRTAVILRHRQPSTLYQSYLSVLVPTATAQAFFRIRPVLLRGVADR